MWSRPSAGAGPISRTSEAALRPRDTALKPPLPPWPQSALFLPWVADSADLRPAGTEGPAVFGPWGCRSKFPQPAWLQTTNSFSRGLHTCSPGAAGLSTWRLPATLSHASPCCLPRLSDVSLGSLLPCAPATHPRVSVSPRFQNSQFRVSFHWHRRPGVLTHTHTLPQTSRAYAHLYIFVGLTVITDKSRRGQKLRQRQSHFQFMSIKNGHRLLAWETRWGVFLLSCD